MSINKQMSGRGGSVLAGTETSVPVAAGYIIVIHVTCRCNASGTSIPTVYIIIMN